MRFSQYSHGGGCGCKISPAILRLLLQNQQHNQLEFENLLVGIETNDDAAVYKISENQAVVTSLDFFPPLVDDPYLYGRIAACNAVSDIYAMGGNPILAMAILGMPVDKIGTDIMREVLIGGESVCKELNIPLAGGHSIDLTEPIYGLSVTGIVDLCYLKRNNTASIDDVILLSKPIGVGIIATAIKNQVISIECVEYKQFVETITKINSVGSKLAKIDGVSAMTDVTGFGLLGHLYEMVVNSNLTANITYSSVPIIELAVKLAKENRHTSGAKRNYIAYEQDIFFDKKLEDWQMKLLCDPQTNGGLLLTVSQEKQKDVIEQLFTDGFSASIIGYMEKYKGKFVCVNN